MSSLKILTAAIAAATFSLAFAQGTPPKPATDPAVGAGQRSSQGTPMGTTGTPGGGGAMAQGSSGASGAAATTAGSAGGSSAAMNSGATTRATPSATTGGGTTMAADTGTTHKHKATKKKARKTVKADRN